MLRKTLFVFCLMFACSLVVVAQDHAKAEVFGGYQWTSVDVGSGIDRQNFNGWDAALTGYFNKNFGITADFSGNYKSIEGVDVKAYTYLFGPTVRVPMQKATPFVHALFGGAHLSADDLTGSESAFSYAIGGGVDVNAGKHVAIRIAQFDYLGTRFDGLGSDNQNNFRYSAGVVFKF